MTVSGSNKIKMPSGFWTALQHIGIDPIDVLRGAKLPAASIAEPSLPVQSYFAIWQTYADLCADPAEAVVRMVGAFETAHYPPTVLATYHARDYRDALQRTVRYKRLCPPEALRIKESGDRCTIELEWTTPEYAGPPVLVGTTLAFLLELGRRGAGKPIAAEIVEFVDLPGKASILEPYFGCSVRGGADTDRIVLRRKDLDLAFRSFNKELLDLLTPALDRSLGETGALPSFAEKTKWTIKRVFSAGRPNMQTVARELGVSDRTLQRRLQVEQTSFALLLTEARQEQAREYLANPMLDIQDIAFLVGYEDQNSFYRAFRLWEGDTPANWRAKRQP